MNALEDKKLIRRRIRQSTVIWGILLVASLIFLVAATVCRGNENPAVTSAANETGKDETEPAAGLPKDDRTEQNMPGAGKQPEQENEIPAQEPEKETQEPGKEVQEPEKDVQEPEKEAQEPEKETQEPGKEVQKPEKDVQEPEKEAQESEETKTEAEDTESEKNELPQGEDKEADAENSVENGEEVPTEKKLVALTFDDGPYTKVTNRILDVLEANGARATFFVVGERLDTYSDTLKREAALGNQIGNHTYGHPNLNKLSAGKIKEQISKTNEKLNRYITTGEVVMLRPPYGNANETVRATVTVPMINWSLDSRDWESRDAEKIIKTVLDSVKDGDVVLMHDLYESTAQAVEYLVPELIQRGFELVTVEEMFAAKKVELKGGVVYHSAGGKKE